MIVFSSQIFGLITHNAGLCVVERLVFLVLPKGKQKEKYKGTQQMAYSPERICRAGSG